TFTFPNAAFAGLAVTSHNSSTLSTAGMEKVRCSSWSTQDVGSPGLAGSFTQDGASYTLKGSRSDIWGTSDSFRFVYQRLSGNGTIIAHLSAMGNSNANAKSGVMFRNSLGSNSLHAYVAVTPASG